MTEFDRADLDRILPATVGSPDWADVLTRARAGRGHSRRRLVVLAAVALVVVVGTASAIGSVREFFLERGFIGLPPMAATPSDPESGRVVLHFLGRSHTFGQKLSRVWVYDAGRMVWDREGPVPEGANERISGFLEQRLTPEGVELLRSEVLSAGLFGRNRDLLTNAPGSSAPGMVQRASVWGTIEVREGDRLVRLRWENPDSTGREDGTVGTPEELSALERVHTLITDPTSWLPASAWEQRKVKAYVASRYAVCWGWRPNLEPNPGSETVDASRILDLLPPPLARLLRASWRPYVWPLRERCTVVPTEEARSVAHALDNAGLERRGGGTGRNAESLYRLAYGLQPPNVWPGSIFFEPVLPHGEWVCTPCG